jgi:hypothetical protein
MNIRNLGRIGGAVDAGAWSYVGYLYVQLISNIDPVRTKEFFLGNYSIETNVGIGFLGATALLVPPIIAAGITDGLVDIVKGTHHDFGLRVWKKLTRNPETKKSIDNSMAEYERITKLTENSHYEN